MTERLTETTLPPDWAMWLERWIISIDTASRYQTEKIGGLAARIEALERQRSEMPPPNHGAQSSTTLSGSHSPTGTILQTAEHITSILPMLWHLLLMVWRGLLWLVPRVSTL